jgi:hypothetical protein
MATRRAKVYLAGPMTGKPNFNYHKFDKVSRGWRKAGYLVINPANHYDRDQEAPAYSDFIRASLHDLLQADMVAMLPHWTGSRGATLEAAIAHTLNLPIRDAAGREIKFDGYSIDFHI